MPKKYIINTVGTSMLDSGKNLFVGSKYVSKDSYSKKFKDPLENGLIPFNEAKDSDWVKLKDRFVDNMGIALEGNNLSGLSAEISAIKLFYDIKNDIKEDKIVLLYSDTRDGEFCAQVNAEVIARSMFKLPDPIDIKPEVLDNSLDRLTIKEGDQIRVEAKKIKMLRMDKYEEEGIDNLYELLREYCFQRKEDGYELLYFNVTGGYKSIVPLVTDLGRAINAKIFYKYEDAGKLVWLPDYSLIEIMKDKNFRKLIVRMADAETNNITLRDLVNNESSIDAGEKDYYMERLRAVENDPTFRRRLDKFIMPVINFIYLHKEKR